jgi:RNA polymerase sigma-B factor
LLTGKELFKEYLKTNNYELKEEIIKQHYNLVVYVARKFTGRGESLEDIIQVGMLGLMKAMDNYDPTYNAEFATYAMPTIVGEIKHYFRDHSRIVKLPRRLYELDSQIKRFIYEYFQNFDRSPTIEEISKQLNISEEEVLEAMEAGDSSKAISLDAPVSFSDRSGQVVADGKASLMDSLGVDYIENRVIERETLKYAIANILNRREQRIIYMRYYDNLSQLEIATYLKLSQMHVSRLIKDAIEKLSRYIKRNLK